jgi:hypothetical protein
MSKFIPLAVCAVSVALSICAAAGIGCSEIDKATRTTWTGLGAILAWITGVVFVQQTEWRRMERRIDVLCHKETIRRRLESPG